MAQEWTKVEGAAKNDAGEYQALVGGKWQPATGAAKNDAGEYMALMDSTPAAPTSSVMDSVKSVPSAIPGNNGIQFGANGLSTVSSRAQDIAVQRAAKPKVEGPAADTMAATSEFLKGSGSPLVSEQTRVHPKPEVGLANAIESSGRYVDKVNADRSAERGVTAEAAPYTSSLGAGAAQILSNVADTPAFVNDVLKTFVINPILHTAGQEGMEPTQRSAIAKDLQQAADEYTPKTSKLMDLDFNNPQEVGHWVAVNALKNAPQIATGYAASAIPKLRAAYLGLMGITSGAGQYQRNLEKGVNQKDSMLDAVTNGAFEVIGEMTGFAAFDKIGGIIKAMPVGQRAAVAQEAIKKLMVGVAATSGQMVAGGTGEGITQFGQNLSQKYVAGDKTVGLMDGVPDAIAIGAIMEAPTSIHQGVQAVRKPQSAGSELGQALQESVNSTRFDPRSVSEAALRSLSPSGSLPVSMPIRAATESARQRKASTGVEQSVIPDPSNPAMAIVVPTEAAQALMQQAAPEAAQPIEQPNAGMTTDDILGGGLGAPVQPVSAEDAAMLQGAQEQGIPAQADPVIEQQAAAFDTEVATPISAASTPISAEVDHFANGVTPEALDTFFADAKERHIASITPSEGTNGTNIAPANTRLAVDPAIAASLDTFGGQSNSLLGNEGGFYTGSNRLAGQPAPGAEQPDAGRAEADNAVSEPRLAPRMTRLYHGSATHGRYDGKAWFSTSRTYAENYRNGAELQYVDVPTIKINRISDPDGYGQTPDKGFTFNGEFDSSDVGVRKPIATHAQAMPAQKKAPVASENLLARIKQLGGIDLNHIRDITGESNTKNVRAVGLFSKTGKGLDDLAVMLHDEGFDVGMHDDTDNGGVNRLANQIRSALDGNAVLTTAATERKAAADVEAEHNHYVKEQAKALGIKTVARKMAAIEADVIAHQKAADQAKFDALQSELQKYGLVLDATISEAQSLIGEQGVSSALRHAGEFIENNDITDESAQISAMIESVKSEVKLRKNHDEIQDPNARQVAEGLAGQSDRAGGIQDRPEGNREGQSGRGFELTGQTAEEIAASERAQDAQDAATRDDEAKAKAEQAKKDQDAVDAKVKARTDNADNFQFGESSKDAVKPEGDLFNQLKTPLEKAELTGHEFGGMLHGKELREAASTYARNNFVGKSYANISTGNSIEVTWQGIKHAVAGANDIELRAIHALPDILSSATFVSSEKDHSGRADIIAAHKYQAEISVAGEKLMIGVVVRENSAGHKFYDQFVVKQKTPTGTSEAASASGEKLGVQPSVGVDANVSQPAAESKPADKITLMAVSNKPFPTEKSALSSIKQRKLNATPVPVEGGFGIKHAPDLVEPKESSSKTGANVAETHTEDAGKAAREKADADFDDAMGDLGDIFGKNFRATFTPEQEQKILPVLARLFDAAFRKGYYKFKEAARFVLDSISSRLGNEVADEITIDHLQGAYIGMAGRYKEQGADSKRDVAAFESKDELGESNVTDKRSGASLERDSADTNTSDGVGAQGVRDGRNGDGGTGGQGILDSESESGSRRSDGIPGRDAATDGERGNLEIYTGASPDEASIARDRVDQRSDSTGVDGSPIESDATSVAEELAESGVSLEEARAEQRKADAQEHKPGIENIRKTLPILTEAQQDDVHIAETRFSKPDGYGMLFTNGTGTGKTFTGLGIIKRFVTSGKNNIIITAPNDKIADDWKNAGRLLGLDITRLPDTKSAGSGVVIATYANFGQNNELAKRNWDLIVHDEAHYLAMDKNGTNTLSLHNLRAISMNPAGASTRANMLHADLIDNLAKVHADIKAARESGDDRHLAKLPVLEAKEKTLVEKWRAATEAVKADVESKQGESRPRVLFLSATPFAYEKTVDWANGYLFDYNEGRGKEGSESRGYNAGSNSDQFMMQHFGYRMRYGKLTAPDAKVDSGLMQRQFNTMLKKSGVLSGRMLDVKADYDRRFVLVDSAIGSRIDAALQWFEDQRKGGKDEKSAASEKNDTRSEALRDLRDVIGEKFDYLSRRYLLEAIKAQEVIPHVKEHLALGRKVVVFHDYKKGGGFNPFDVSSVKAGGDVDPARASAYNAAVREFRAEFKDLIDSDVWRASSPITAFQQEFSGTTHPKVLLFNGDVSAKDRRAAVEKFQDDASGPQVILVQSAAGKEGISLHDTTGKHQRVLFNLGQPTQPTTAIQQEGRIYRTGQATDAIFRYLNTGTNWEKWAFATTIAQRASAAENLGMGEQARALKDAFITGFEESGDYRAGMEDEGKGGKERDRAANNALTEYDRARAFYFGTQKKNSRTKAQEGADYFATPEPVGLKMVELADIRPGESALEPSAGHGAIARWMPTTAERSAIEPSTVLRPRLAMVFDGKIIGSDFEDMHVSNKFDAIVMNPPFGVGGKTAIEHLAKAATHLRDGGRIVALIPQGGMADKRFDKWMYEEEERPVKPLIEHPTLGRIYLGDTVQVNGYEAVKLIARGIDAGGLEVSNAGRNYSTHEPLSRIIGIEPTGKRVTTYSPSKGFHLVADIKMPPVTFERAGTAVNTRIVVIEKSDKAPQFTQRDYSGETDINELFNRMESLSISPRAKAAESIEEAAAPKRESKVAALDAQASKKESIAREGGQLAASNSDATFEIKDGKLVTNSPTEKVITGKGKELEGVFVPFDKLTQAQIKEADAFTYMPKGKAHGWFVRLRHVERPSINNPAMLSISRLEGYGKAEGDPLAEIRAKYLAATRKGMSADAVSKATVQLRARWLGFQKVNIVQSFSDLPDDLKLSSMRSGSRDAEGVYGINSKQVYLVADNLRSPEHAVWVAIHETVGHAGLRMLDSSIANIITKVSGNPTVAKLARAISKDRDETFSHAKHTEEALAELAAAQLTNGTSELLERYGIDSSGITSSGLVGALKRIIETVRRFVANALGKKLTEVSDAEVRSVIDSARRAVETRAQQVISGADNGMKMAGIDGSDLAMLSKPSQQPIGLNTPIQPSSIIPEETEFEKRQRQVQDKMIRFAVLQKWLKFKGVSLTEKANVHANENLMHAKIANQTQDFRDHIENPLIERAAKAGFTLSQIADYLEAQHIPEANARMRDIHHDSSATANGITDAEANQALAEFQAMPKFAEFKKIADEFRAIGDDTLNLRLREGLISQEQHNAYKGTYQHWVPLRGNGKKPGVGKGLSVNAKEKRRLGHGQREDGEMVIENLLMDRERAIYQVEHNRVGKSIIQFALEAKEPDMVTVGKPEKRQVLKDQQVFEVQYKGRMMRAFSSESDAKSFINQAIALSSSRQGGGMARSNFAIAKSNDPIVVMQASPMLAENEIQVYVAGHTIRVQLNDELLARAATNMGVDQVNSLLAAGRIINNGLSKIYTAYSPDFIFRNAIRDFIAGTINLTGDMGVKMAGKIYANYGKAAKELFIARNDPRKSAWVQRYRSAGGNTGAAYLSDIERIGADAQAAMYERMKGMEVYRNVHDRLIGDGHNQVYAHTAAAMKTSVAKFSSIPVLGHFLTLIEHLNAVTENALRLATYMTMVQNGYTEQQAAVAAKNSTVNFNRKGEISNVMGSAYLFFNPSVQGATRMFSSLAKSEHKGQAQAMAGMLAFAAFALAELGRCGDDDDERKWKNIPDHVKDHNLIFKFGDLQWTIPVPYEFAPFHVLGNSISNAVHGESGWKASMKVLKSLVDNLSPLGDPFAGEGKDGANLFQIIPTVVKMVLAPHENENSFASPIQPEKNSFSKNKPDSQNMFRNTGGSLYAGAAEWVNEVTGGSDYKTGGVDVSPEVLKFWVSTLTGGTGRFVTDSIDAVYGATQGVAPDLRSTPVARVFVRESSVSDSRARFWEAANEAKVAADELAMAKKDHNGGAVKEIRDAEGDMVRLSKMADRMGKAASKKRDAIDEIRQDDQMPLEQKREKMKEIERKEGEYYDRFLKMFDQKQKERRDKAA